MFKPGVSQNRTAMIRGHSSRVYDVGLFQSGKYPKFSPFSYGAFLSHRATVLGFSHKRPSICGDSHDYGTIPNVFPWGKTWKNPRNPPPRNAYGLDLMACSTTWRSPRSSTEAYWRHRPFSATASMMNSLSLLHGVAMELHFAGWWKKWKIKHLQKKIILWVPLFQETSICQSFGATKNVNHSDHLEISIKSMSFDSFGFVDPRKKDVAILNHPGYWS